MVEATQAKIFKDLKVMKKLILLILLPVFFVSFMIVWNIVDKTKINHEMEKLKDLTTLSAKYSGFLHESQKERGLTLLFLNSKGQKYHQELLEQYQNTDEKRGTLLTYYKQFNKKQKHDENLRLLLSQSVNGINHMNLVRRRVKGLSMSPQDSYNAYTEMNTTILHAVTALSKQSNNAEVYRLSLTYIQLMWAKDYAGRERAMLAKAFANNQFAPGDYAKYLSTLATQNTYLEAFQSLASKAQNEKYKPIQQEERQGAVGKLRNIAISKGNTGNFNINPSAWFGSASERINSLKTVEDQVRNELIAKTEALKTEATTSLILSLILLALPPVSILFALFASKSIINPLKDCVDYTQRIAKGDLSSRLSIEQRDEIGELSCSLTSMGTKLRDLITEIASSAALVTESSVDLSTGSDLLTLNINNLFSASNQISENNHNVNSAAHEMSNNIESIAGTTEDLSSTLCVISSAVEEITSSLSEVAKNTAYGAKVSGRSGDVAQKTQESVINLQKTIDQIDKVTNLINNIASQTKLLALNASIEAASSGQNGNGFAVVAAEVKSLAKDTENATVEIKKQIAEIQEAMRLSTEAISEIVSISKEVDTINTTIASAVEEQSAVINEISKNISDAAQSSTRISTQVKQSAVVAKDVSVQMGEANAKVNDMRTNLSVILKGSSNEDASQKIGATQIQDTAQHLLQLADKLHQRVTHFKL